MAATIALSQVRHAVFDLLNMDLTELSEIHITSGKITVVTAPNHNLGGAQAVSVLFIRDDPEPDLVDAEVVEEPHDEVPE